MTSERWQQIETIFHAALQREPDARGSFVAQACGEDSDLQREIEALLSKDALAAAVLDRPAADLLGESTETVLAPGARLGPYQIEGALGAGGMGVVYRALDTRLLRKVAIKVLHERFSSRFEREARAISLNHPHVCTLHDVGPNYLVMELVEGETLAARSKKSALPLDQVARYGAQIAEGLAAAHAHGIIHCDLKPGNIMLTKTGVKVLDFGLAKLESSPGAAQESKTLAAEHAILGTLAYMAPEQLTGQPCDARTDIYALGLVLYEMATGKRWPQDQPAPLDALPERLAHVIERCLAPDPEQRWQSARDIAADLDWAARPERAGIPSGERRRPTPGTFGARPNRRIVLVAGLAAIALASAAAGVSFWLGRSTKAESPQLRLLTYSGHDSSPAASPDGKTVAFSSDRDGTRRIWLIDRVTGSEVALSSGPGDNYPRFSPDGSMILFLRTEADHTSLYRMAVGEPSPANWMTTRLPWVAIGLQMGVKSCSCAKKRPAEPSWSLMLMAPERMRSLQSEA